MRQQLQLLADLALITSASVVATLLMADFDLDVATLRRQVPHLILIALVALPVLSMFGLNRTIWRLSGTADYARAAATGCLVAGLTWSISGTLAVGEPVRQAVPVLDAMLMAMALVGVRTLLSLRRRGGPMQMVGASPYSGIPVRAHRVALIVGFGGVARQYLRSLGEISNGDVRVAGILCQSDRHVGFLVQHCEVLGLPHDIERVVGDLGRKGVSVTDIVVATASRELDAATQLALGRLALQGLHIDRLVDRAVGGERSTTAAVPGFFLRPAMLEQLAERPYFRAKRTLDRLAAFVLFAGVLPVMGVVALVVALDVGKPVLFWQRRPGLRGKPMTVHKFRTMGAGVRNGVRIPDSERLSIVGRFLRATRLDELPQLWCILAGDMSFIGPRPLLPIDQPAMYAARLLVRPGLTGYAQVKGGRTISPADKAVLDVWYLKNASLIVDVKIVLETARMVVFGEREDRVAIDAAWQDLYASGIVAEVPLTSVGEIDMSAEPSQLAA